MRSVILPSIWRRVVANCLSRRSLPRSRAFFASRARFSSAAADTVARALRMFSHSPSRASRSRWRAMSCSDDMTLTTCIVPRCACLKASPKLPAAAAAAARPT